MYNRIIAVALLLSHVERSDGHGGYCVKACVGEDPCGDGKAQQQTCASPNITNWDTFDVAEGTSFVGCSHSVCDTACAAMNSTLTMDIQDGTICFPMSDSMMLYEDRDLAEMCAVSKGCSGSHFMSMSGKWMPGSSHTACDASYVEEGLAFTSSATKVSLYFVFITGISAALFSI